MIRGTVGNVITLEVGEDYKRETLVNNIKMNQNNDDYFEEIDFEQDLPKEKVRNSFIVIGSEENEEYEAIVAYESELQAYRAYKNISCKNKKIIKGTAIYGDLFGMRVLLGYE